MSLSKDLKRLCEAAMNEGAGASVEFNFDEDKYNKNYSGEPASFESDGLKVKVSHLLLSDYDNNAYAEDGGYIEFDENEVKKEAVQMYNKYDRLIDDSEITESDVKSIDEIAVESIPNLQYSWGWSRVELPKDTVLSWDKNNPNGYVPILEVSMTLNNGEQITAKSVNVDGKYHVSEDVYYAYLSLDEDDIDESVDEPYEEIMARTYQRMFDEIKNVTGTGFLIDALRNGKYTLSPYRFSSNLYEPKMITDKDLLPLKNKNEKEQRDYLLNLLRKTKKANEAMERFLSVEYNEANPKKQSLVLYNGPAVVDRVEIDLKDPARTKDQIVRDIAKEHFDNITDDIRVAWF